MFLQQWLPHPVSDAANSMAGGNPFSIIKLEHQCPCHGLSYPPISFKEEIADGTPISVRTICFGDLLVLEKIERYYLHCDADVGLP